MHVFCSVGGELIHIVKEGDKYKLKYKLKGNDQYIMSNKVIEFDDYNKAKEFKESLQEIQTIRKYFDVKKIDKFICEVNIKEGKLFHKKIDTVKFLKTYLKANSGKKAIIRIEVLNG